MKILLLSKDKNQLRKLNQFIKQNICFDTTTILANNIQDAKSIIVSENPAIILSYLYLTDGSIFNLIEEFTPKHRKYFILEKDLDFAIKAIRSGVSEMIDFEFEQNELISFLQKSESDLHIRKLERSISELKSSKAYPKIIIKTNTIFEEINLDELLLIKQTGKHVLCKLYNREVRINNCKLNELTNKINAGFLFELNSKVVINRLRLEKIQKQNKSYMLIFDNDIRITVKTLLYDNNLFKTNKILEQ